MLGLTVGMLLSLSDRKACQNIEEHVDEIAYNAAAFYWNSSMNAKVHMWLSGFYSQYNVLMNMGRVTYIFPLDP